MKHTIKITLNEAEYEILLKFCGGKKHRCSPTLKQFASTYINGLASLMDGVQVMEAAEQFAKLTGSVARLKASREEKE